MNERTETHASDLISRQAAIEAVSGCGICIQKILDLPPAETDLSAYSDKLWRAAYERGKKEAEAERKRGKWVKVSADKYRISASYFYECSECKFVNQVKSNFCPVCGAAMGGLENVKA